MRHITMLVGAMCTGFFALMLTARAGSGDAFSPLTTIELYGSACRSGAHTVGGAAVAFVCEFDHTLAAGLMGMPEFSEEAVANVTLLEKNLERNTPLERHTLQLRVAKVRLEDGSECLNVMGDKTLFAGAEPVTFTCTPGHFGLVGPFERLNDMLLAERVVLSEAGGLEPYGTLILPVTSLTLDAESGAP